MRNKFRGWLKRFRWVGILLVLLAVLALFGCFWEDLKSNSATLRNLSLIVFGIIGLPLAIWRSSIADKNVKIADRNSVTDLFTKAIEQLGSGSHDKPNIEVRLGAIYSLEKLSKTNNEYYQTIIDILASYVRENAPIPPESERKPDDITRTDVQAAMTVLSRRTRKSKEPQLNLRAVYLPRVILNNKACLTGANLDGAYLRKAKLDDADLQEAELNGADLQEAELVGADLFHAQLEERANLKGTNLIAASLAGAYLDVASLQGAYLGGAQLYGTLGLTCAQLTSAINWELAYRDEQLACGAEIPPPPPSSGR